MKQYHDLVKLIFSEGRRQPNRTGVDTIKVFGAMAKFDLQKGFPLLTTKKMAWKTIVKELLWFISGSTDVSKLMRQGVHIWDQDAYNKYLKDYKAQDIDERKIPPVSFEEYSNGYCPLSFYDLGYGTYGSMWREFPPQAQGEIAASYTGIDQLSKVIQTLKTNPDDRRMIVSAWHPGLVDSIALPPCHVLFHFNTSVGGTGERVLDLALYQRSCDLFLGVPFNIASYALLLHLVAYCVDMKVGTFTHFYGDLHIYVNHLSQMAEQIEREPFALPSLQITGPKYIDKLTLGDIHLHNYKHHEALKGELNTGLKV